MIKKIIPFTIICVFLAGCSSLTDIQKKELTEYVEYSNKIIEETFKNDSNKAARLEPYRARYRVTSEIIQKLND